MKKIRKRKDLEKMMGKRIKETGDAEVEELKTGIRAVDTMDHQSPRMKEVPPKDFSKIQASVPDSAAGEDS